MTTSPEPGVSRQDHGDATPWQVAIVAPARDEAERIEACLDAAAVALRGRGGIVVAVNGASDATRARAEAWFRAGRAPGVLIDEPAPPSPSGVGRARRLGVEACADRLAPGAAVMTSDADSRVAPDWVDANLAELARADLICGTILLDPAESADLPEVMEARGALEARYVALTLAVRRALDPLPHDPAPTHMYPGGASLAFRMALYEDVGGFPDLAMREDRFFVETAEARDWRIRHSDAARVWTSCRLDGRTSGGLAGMLRARIADEDPLVDELLAPAAETVFMARLKGALRREWADRPGFGAAWARIRLETRQLQPARMRLSDLGRELPKLAAAVWAFGSVSAQERVR